MPTSAANFVELEALRWENRKLSDAKAVAETEVRPPAVLPHYQALPLCMQCVSVSHCYLYKALVAWWAQDSRWNFVCLVGLKRQYGPAFCHARASCTDTG